MNRPSAMRVPSPDATEKVAPVEMHAASNNLPAVAERPSPKEELPKPALPAAFPVTGVAAIAGAIAGVMSDIGVVVKDGRNKFHNYSYAKMEDILQQLTPLIAKNGLAIIQTEVDRAMFDNDNVIAVRYAFTILHKSGEVWPERPIQTGVSRCRNSKDGFDDKALNKAHTAARKYFLLALFQIPTGDEDDADRGETSSTPPRAASRRAPVPSPTGKVAPHAVSTDGEKLKTWTTKFTAFVAKAESETELTAWEKLNGMALDLVYEKEPKLYDAVLKAFEARREALGTKADPAPKKDSGIPDAATSPEEFLKWADAQLAAVSDPHALESVYNDLVEPQAEGLFPPDKEELVGIFSKHERRLAP